MAAKTKATKKTVKAKAKPAARKQPMGTSAFDILSGTFDDADQTGTLIVDYQASNATDQIQADGKARAMKVTVTKVTGGKMRVTLQE